MRVLGVTLITFDHVTDVHTLRSYIFTHIKLKKLQNVLFTVAYTCAADSKTTEPCPPVQPCHVHGVLLSRVLFGEKTLHNL